MTCYGIRLNVILIQFSIYTCFYFVLYGFEVIIFVDDVNITFVMILELNFNVFSRLIHVFIGYYFIIFILISFKLFILSSFSTLLIVDDMILSYYQNHLLSLIYIDFINI